MQGHTGTMVGWERRLESVEMVRAISVMLSVDFMALERHFAIQRMEQGWYYTPSYGCLCV